ncbi:MAG: 16S rRNA pseudouridine(516) synthase, partial [Oscillospiraceae bacterium]|nr:16S rRNA pseudouridine(516) synthase [Oscillospiraceae bacterium]
MERLDKFISTMTDYTRSQIKKLASDGKIQVNSENVKDCSLKINPESDRIYVCKREITFKEKVYFLMNKPEGVVCATADRRDKTVLDLLSDDVKRKDLFPAGRLDKDTRGMVLIT